MKAIAAESGRIQIVELAQSAPAPGHVTIHTEYSAMSPGTELGIMLRSKETPIVLGYSAVGIVSKVGEGVDASLVGRRVACYGAPYVRHAESMNVPTNLTAVVPEHVDPREAAFAGLGAIAIHALRVADLRFGESVVVVGLGILGNLIAQIASSAGYVCVGIDLAQNRVEHMQKRGGVHVFLDSEELEAALPTLTGGIGADSVLLCAAGPGEALINRAFDWIRDRGKIVIVGDLTTQFSRGKMFAKEAQVLISRAGGPGRYDAEYERNNRDYPPGFVRWTEGRNVGEYIRLLAEKRIRVAPLITGSYTLEQAADAYALHQQPNEALGTLFTFVK